MMMEEGWSWTVGDERRRFDANTYLPGRPAASDPGSFDPAKLLFIYCLDLALPKGAKR